MCVTILVSFDSQASTALPAAILPRSSLAQLVVLVTAQYSRNSFSVQLLGLLSAPPSCNIFIRNVTSLNPERRLLSNSVVINMYVLSRRSDSEAQKSMDDLGGMWRANPKALQAIGVVDATFEIDLPVFSPRLTSSPTTRDEANSNSLPEWFVPSISVISGSILVGILSFFVYKQYRSRKLTLRGKTSSQNSSFNDSELTNAEDVDEDQHEMNDFVSIDIDGNLNSAAQGVRADSHVEGAGVNARHWDPHKEYKKYYGVSIGDLVTCPYRGYSVPLIAATLMDFVLNMGGPTTPGIFRLSAASRDIAAARNHIEVRAGLLIHVFASDTATSDVRR